MGVGACRRGGVFRLEALRTGVAATFPQLPRFLFCFPYGERLPAGAGAWLGSDDATLQRVVDAVFEPDDKRRPVTAEEARRSSPDCFRALANCSRRLEALCDDQGR